MFSLRALTAAASAAALAVIGVGVAGTALHASAVGSTSTPPVLGVYRGAPSPGPTNVAAFEKWAGHPTPYALDFTASADWASLEGPSWQLTPWQGSGRRLVYTVNMLPGPADRSYDGGVSLEACASGSYNSHWLALATSLVAHGLPTTIVRPGHEFNGSWYAWAAYGHQAAYAGCFRQIVTTMRSVSGQAFQFDWSPNIGTGQFPAEQAWPGDAYVDYVGVDTYDQSWVPNSYPLTSTMTAAQVLSAQKNSWTALLSGDHGLQFWTAFTLAHGKKLSIPEWGLTIRPDGHGGGDDPYYVQQMLNYIADPASNVAYANYFEFDAPDGTHRMSSTGTYFPNGAAMYRSMAPGVAAGGSSSPAATSASPTPTTTSAAPTPTTTTASPTPTTTTTAAAPPVTPTDTATSSPTATQAGPAPTGELLRSDATRDDLGNLDGSTIGSSVFAYLDVSATSKSVAFYVDDPTGTTTPVRTEYTAPFDLGGTGVSGPLPYDTSGLSGGWHKVTAAVTAADGTRSLVTASVLVPKTTGVRWSSSGSRSPSSALAGATVSGKIAVFVTAPAATKVSFWLDAAVTATPKTVDTAAPFDLLGGSTGSATMLNTLNLSPGAHTITTQTVFPDGTVVTDTATFTVAVQSKSKGRTASCSC